MSAQDLRTLDDSRRPARSRNVARARSRPRPWGGMFRRFLDRRRRLQRIDALSGHPRLLRDIGLNQGGKFPGRGGRP